MKHIVLLFIFIVSAMASAAAQTEGLTSALTLEQAQSLALQNNPELSAFSLEIKAREAQILQAGLIPNPEISFTIENFGGAKDLNGFESAETTVELSQMIELGGKRSKRQNVASIDRELAQWDYEAKLADILAEVKKAFIDVLALQEKIALKEELVRLSEEIYKAISVRVSSGKISPVEETKAGVALASVRIELDKAKHEFDASRQRLSSFWGTEPSFEKAQGKLDAFSSVPQYEELKKIVGKNPDIARWSKETEQKNAALRLEEAKRMPDPTVGLGLRHLNDVDTNAFVVGVSIPLPFFNRNQGGVIEAQQRISQTAGRQKNAELRILATLAEAHQVLSSSYAEAAALKNEILPGSLNAFESAKEGYLHGKFNYLDVLDAQRTYFEAKNRYIEVLAAYHKALADVKRLTGDRIETVSGFLKEKA